MLTEGRALALVRMGLGIATILNAGEIYVVLTQIDRGALSMPVIELIPSPSAPALTVYLGLATLCGTAIALGYHVAIAATLSTILSLGAFMWDQQAFSSHRWLGLLMVAYLIWARSDSEWAVTSRSAREVPWWPRLLMMSQLSVCYFFAAVSKVNAAFLSGVPLAGWTWFPLPVQAFQILAVGAVATELFLAFALWSRRWRRPAALLGVLLHVSILVGLPYTWDLVAFALTCVPVYLLFLTRPATEGGLQALLDRAVEAVPAAPR